MKITLTLEVPDEEVRAVRHWNCGESDAVHTKVEDLFHEALSSAVGAEDGYFELTGGLTWDEHPGYAKFVDEFWRVHELSPLEQLAEATEC